MEHSSRKERIKFSKEDWNLIFAHFGMLITSDRTESITTKAVTEILKNPALADLVKVYGHDTLLAKIRTEKKKFLKEKTG